MSPLFARGALLYPRREGGHEGWLREVNAVLAAYRRRGNPAVAAVRAILQGQSPPVPVEELTLEEAVGRLRKLGLSEGDALRYLKKK